MAAPLNKINFNINIAWGTFLTEGAPSTSFFLLDSVRSTRACLKNASIPKERVFFRVALPNSLEIHKVFLRKFLFSTQKPTLVHITIFQTSTRFFQPFLFFPEL